MYDLGASAGIDQVVAGIPEKDMRYAKISASYKHAGCACACVQRDFSCRENFSGNGNQWSNLR